VQFAVQLCQGSDEYIFKIDIRMDAVMGAAETAIREVVGKSKMDFVLYEGRDANCRPTRRS